MKIIFAPYTVLLIFISFGLYCNAQTGAESPVTPQQQSRHRASSVQYPRIPGSDFTKIWKGEEYCGEKDTSAMTLTITAKDSFNLNISGFYGHYTLIEGKIKGYAITINRQSINSVLQVEGRMVLSNERKTLKSFLHFTSEGKEIPCTGTYFHP